MSASRRARPSGGQLAKNTGSARGACRPSRSSRARCIRRGGRNPQLGSHGMEASTNERFGATSRRRRYRAPQLTTEIRGSTASAGLYSTCPSISTRAPQLFQQHRPTRRSGPRSRPTSGCASVSSPAPARCFSSVAATRTPATSRGGRPSAYMATAAGRHRPSTIPPSHIACGQATRWAAAATDDGVYIVVPTPPRASVRRRRAWALSPGRACPCRPRQPCTDEVPGGDRSSARPEQAALAGLVNTVVAECDHLARMPSALATYGDALPSASFVSAMRSWLARWEAGLRRRGDRRLLQVAEDFAYFTRAAVTTRAPRAPRSSGLVYTNDWLINHSSSEGFRHRRRARGSKVVIVEAVRTPIGRATPRMAINKGRPRHRLFAPLVILAGGPRVGRRRGELADGSFRSGTSRSPSRPRGSSRPSRLGLQSKGSPLAVVESPNGFPVSGGRRRSGCAVTALPARAGPFRRAAPDGPPTFRAELAPGLSTGSWRA